MALFLSAGEARRRLQVSSSIFKMFVETKKIRTEMSPNEKQVLYREEDVQRIAQDMQSFMDIYLLASVNNHISVTQVQEEKEEEYRRKFVHQPTTTFLYLGTTPADPLSGSIPAKVQFGTPIVDYPSRIGELAESQKPGSSASILAYMADREKGYAIPVLSV